MKKFLSIFLITLSVLMILSVVGILLYRHFVMEEIMDKGGMINPDYRNETDTVSILDGENTYVDNEKLLQRITGTWVSEDEHYSIKIDRDYHIVFSFNDDILLEDFVRFTYLQPVISQSTELSLNFYTLQKKDGSSVGEITSIYHEDSEEDLYGYLFIEFTLAGNNKIVKLQKQKQ